VLRARVVGYGSFSLCVLIETRAEGTLIQTYHSDFIPEGVSRGISDSFESPTFYQNYLAMRNTADVFLIAVSPSDRSLTQV
jgi:hypothetical protein